MKIYFLFLVFSYHLFEIKTISKYYCKDNNHIYKIGENYTKSYDNCMICTCINQGEEVCTKILLCRDIDCFQTYSFGCCHKLNCGGFYFLIR